MRRLPHQSGVPRGLSLEKPGGALASLSITPELRRLYDHVLVQWQNRSAFADIARFGITPINRVLFYGPPGNGKTTACQWIASKLDCSLYRVRCETLVDAYVGKTTSNIADIMEFLGGQDDAVVLFDEVESIFPARGSSRGEIGREFASAMSVFWQYLDRWQSPQIFVLATNMVERLDPALLSRIELQLRFDGPTTEQATEVINYWSEIFAAYGSEEWAPKLVGREWESFRQLWHAITSHVREAAIAKRPEPAPV